MRSRVVLGAAALFLLVGAAWWWNVSGARSVVLENSPGAAFDAAPGFTTPEDGPVNTASPTNTLKPPREAPAGYAEYRSERYRFQLFYPNSLSVKTYDEGGGASTITLQNTTTAQGFQLFIVPYSAPQVSEARFKKDEPSGVMQEPHNVTVDGVFGTMFYGKQTLLGDTYEVWFIRGGYLFEVTTLKPLENWLQGIMGSFQFI